MFVELRDCWATPDANSGNINSVSLIRNGCPVEDASLNVFIHNSGNVETIKIEKNVKLTLNEIILNNQKRTIIMPASAMIFLLFPLQMRFICIARLKFVRMTGATP